MLVSIAEPVTRRRPGRPRADETRPSVRESLLAATIELVAAHGPLSVNARQVCDRAGVMYAAVNYNFGSWNGLLAAASSQVYTCYVDQLWDRVTAAAAEPRARLRAYIEAQVEWSRQNPGWGAVFNYPVSVEDVTKIRIERDTEETVGLFRLNLARLEQLVIDVRDGTVTDIEYGVGEIPEAALLADHKAVARSTSIGWSTMGMAVWASRGSTGEAQLSELKGLEAGLMNFHIESMIDAIATDRA